MKLYATVSSERASKGQGGKWLDIKLVDEDRSELFFLKVEPQENNSAPWRMYVSGEPHFLRVLKNHIALYLDLNPQGNRFDELKGEKQKGEVCSIAGCDTVRTVDGTERYYNGHIVCDLHASKVDGY